MSTISTRLCDRRRFLSQAGGAAAAIATGGAIGSETPLATVHAAEVGPLNGAQRDNKAYLVRQQAALFQKNQPRAPHVANTDETLPGYIAFFTKSLPHDANGEVDPFAYAALMRAMTTGDPADFAAIPMGGGARLANPQAAFAFDFIGGDSHAFAARTPPSFGSAETAGEMTELYWHALTRDVPFIEFGSNGAIAAACASLSGLSDFRGPKAGGAVTPATVFRGPTAGDLTGPYISQFLYRDVPSGPYVQQQRVREALPGADYLTSYGSWLAVQNGGSAGTQLYNGTTRRYVANARDLAEYVHRDYTYQAFLNAALMLLSGGPAALADTNPYKASGNQGGFTTFGPAQILDCVATIANLALHATWFHKWSVHRRLRPEEYGGRVHNKIVAGAAYPIHSDLFSSGVLDAVLAATGTYLLPIAYVEGCPTHPAYPAGHAAMAGAAATLLKAFFKETNTMASPVEASADGSALVPCSGTLTVRGELDKLASNISIGRDVAGVHWRTDGAEGMNLGEQVAIRYLMDLRRSFNEPFDGFSFTMFDGTTKTI